MSQSDPKDLYDQVWAERNRQHQIEIEFKAAKQKWERDRVARDYLRWQREDYEWERKLLRWERDDLEWAEKQTRWQREAQEWQWKLKRREEENARRRAQPNRYKDVEEIDEEDEGERETPTTTKGGRNRQHKRFRHPSRSEKTSE
jgi:hypothetical protein